MNLYEKFKSVHHPLLNPFVELLGADYDNGVEVKITPQTILNKVVGYAMQKLRNPDTKWIVLTAHDSATNLAEKCARILHRKFPDLHQCDSSNYKIREDIWTPKDLSSNLDNLSVKCHTAVLWIFLTKTELPEKLKHHPQKFEVKSKQHKRR